jgi:hypothetical protein
MRTRLRSVGVMMMAVVAVVALASVRTVAAAPQIAQAPEPLTALLAEVHALRIAMEQSATVALRVQLTLARLNIEEQRIAQLAAQLNQVRRELSGASLESHFARNRIGERQPQDRAVSHLNDDRPADRSYWGAHVISYLHI